jgi:GT2 family glycosyltransferase
MARSKPGVNPSLEVTVLIPTLDRDDLLERCLSGLEKQSYRLFEALVVDNGTRNAPPAAMTGLSWARWIPLHRNRGTASAFNRGIAEATRSSFILLLNNDVELESECLAKLVQALKANRTYSVAIPKLLAWADPLRQHQPPPQVPQVVGEHTQPKPHLVRSEPVATQQRHLRSQPWQLCTAHAEAIRLVV